MRITTASDVREGDAIHLIDGFQPIPEGDEDVVEAITRPGDVIGAGPGVPEGHVRFTFPRGSTSTLTTDHMVVIR